MINLSDSTPAAPAGSTNVAFQKDNDGNVSASLATPYDVVCSYVGKPDAGATVFLMTFSRSVTFSDEWAGSRGSDRVDPTATAEFTIQKNGVACGSVSISTSGIFTFVTSSPAGEISFAAGDRMAIVAPDPQDATLEDIAFTLVGAR